MVQLEHKLRQVVDEAQDSLRIYRLREPREQYLQAIGRQPRYDLHDPLVV